MHKTVALLVVLALAGGCGASESKEVETVPVNEKALFAAGCFWGVQAAFDKVKGVVATAVGYTGGHTKNPTYRDVCSDETGHAEAVEIEYDPARVTYRQLLDRFFDIHDPTTRNRQGPDVGSQYRSAIYYFTAEQQADAAAVRDSLAKSGRFARPIVTEIVQADTFWRAEEYHQKYHEKHGGACPVR